MEPVPGAPAILGGDPAFPDGLPLVRPSIPDPESIVESVRKILGSGILTNGPFVEELEGRAREYLGVRHCVAVSSCTTGLMLVLRAAGLAGTIVLPSFTFAATVHAASWNGLKPLFTDVHAETLTLDPARALEAVGARTSAILATHTFGTPCDVEGLERAARGAGVPLFFDAAHAFGSRHAGMPMGRFGDAEVFSLTPTKVLVAGEGGIISTNHDDLAERCRIGRDYGNPGDYDHLFVGLNGRMSEIHAAIGLASLHGLDDRVERRNRLARLYREALESPGISFPVVRGEDRSTYKDFTILVDHEEFGLDPKALAAALQAEGIETRRYYSPPVHTTRAYRNQSIADSRLPVTNAASSRVLTLPLWSDMLDEDVLRVADSILLIRKSLAGRGDGRRVGPTR